MVKYALLSVSLLLGACLEYFPTANIPMHTREHLAIEWRPSYAVAQADAQRLGKPMLVIFGAGEKDGAVCLGADYLRSSALADQRVIDAINRDLVPVWINVRTTPLPPFPFLQDVLVTATVDTNRRVIDNFSRGFFFRSLMVSADGQTLFNPGAKTVREATKQLVFNGSWTFEANEPGEYLSMLQCGMEKYEARLASR